LLRLNKAHYYTNLIVMVATKELEKVQNRKTKYMYLLRLN